MTTEEEEISPTPDDDYDNSNYDNLSDKEREKKVIEFYFVERKPYDYIAKKLRISFTTIADIIKRYKKEKQSNGKGNEKKKKTPTIEEEASVYAADDHGDGNGNGNGDARARLQKQPQMQQQQQQQQRQQQNNQIVQSSSLSLPLSAAELEDLSDKQKAVMAYKLYDQGKSPVQVSVTLCLTAKETMTYHREFLRLKGYHNNNYVISFYPSL